MDRFVTCLVDILLKLPRIFVHQISKPKARRLIITDLQPIPFRVVKTRHRVLFTRIRDPQARPGRRQFHPPVGSRSSATNSCGPSSAKCEGEDNTKKKGPAISTLLNSAV